MMPLPWIRLAPAVILAFATCAVAATPEKPHHTPARADLSDIQNIVVIYAENRSFDNLYGHFPGADGLDNASAAATRQLDRDGTPLATLPKIWRGLTAHGVTPAITEAMTADLPNAPFAIDDPKGFNLADNITTRDLWHRFYENQMQIDGGRNDKFAAWADSGGLVMGHYSTNADNLPLWKIAQQYTLADHFFMGAFGGSFLNHQYLICACAPYYPNADKSPAAGSIAELDADGTLKIAANSPASALEGPPKFAHDGNLTPDFHAVNTMQPPYQPSGNPPAHDGNPELADPAQATTLPPQHATTIGDLLDNAHISWAWYAGAWNAALKASESGQKDDVIYGKAMSTPNFQPHHQPFNYYADFAPGTDNRAKHLLDGGIDGAAFIQAIDSGSLPQVAFYKPQGNLNEHSGYADVASGDRHLAQLVEHLEHSPQWPHMVVIITYDENGGYWDHVAPPKGDRWGPGTRIPAIVVSPFAKRDFVDHTPYDTGSIIRLIAHRFGLPTLPGIEERDRALAAHGEPPMGDLSEALKLPGVR